MFDSQWLISKKGPFGVIWVAAHCLKRVKKDQFKQTDINSSVEKILEVGVPSVNHRILAFLLLGVVRIYSKKVEFLFHDCCDVLDKVGLLTGGKEAAESIEALRRTYDLVSLPERFELDAFDLEILEEQNLSRENVRSPEDMMPSDASREQKKHSSDKSYLQEDNTYSESHFSDYTPVRDVYSPCFLNSNLDAPARDKSNLRSSVEMLCGNWFSEERLEPLMVNFSEIALSFDTPCYAGSKTNKEHIKHTDAEVTCGEEKEEVRLPDEEKSNMVNSCEIGWSPEGRLEPMSFDDVGRVSDIAMMSNEEFQTGSELRECVDGRVINKEPEDLVRLSVKEKNVETKKATKSKRISFPKSVQTDFASNSKFPASPGTVSPDSMVLRTPASKERSGLPKKRKCVYDEAVVLPNRFIKRMIEDSSDLVCKRRKVPHSALQAWKAYKIPSLSKSLLEPLIPSFAGKAVDFGSIKNKTILTGKETEPEESPLKHVSIRSPATFGPDEETIAPGTPVCHSTPSRLHEVRGLSRCDTLKSNASIDSLEELLRHDETQELDSRDMEEISSNGREAEKYECCSLRTRRIASHLLRNFAKQRKLNGVGTVELSQILEKKSKRESARLFYEILVLKTGSYIDVRQKKAYEDILLKETTKLEELVNLKA